MKFRFSYIFLILAIFIGINLIIVIVENDAYDIFFRVLAFFCFIGLISFFVCYGNAEPSKND